MTRLSFEMKTFGLSTKKLKVPQHFTSTYTPWSSGAVYRVGKGFLRCFHAVLSELQMDLDDWTSLVPIVQSEPKNAPSPHWANTAPLTAFKGIPPWPQIYIFLHTDNDTSVTISDVQRERALNLSVLQDRDLQLKWNVNDTLESNRERSCIAAWKGKISNSLKETL